MTWMRWLWLLLPYTAVAAETAAESWRIETLETHALPGACGTVRRLRCSIGPGGPGALITAAVLVVERCRTRLVDQPSGFPLGARSVARTLSEARVTDPAAVLAVNGGYFTRDFASDGLFRLAGVAHQLLSDKAVLSGILAIDAQGRPSLLSRQADLTAYPEALQAGPFVVDPGGLPGVKTPGPAARRTVIASTADGRILVLVTAPLTLAAVSTLLVDNAADFGVTRIERALNLDGGPSAGLVAQTANGIVSLPELGPVRNVVLISAAEARP